jgi:hypothetical protein
VHIVLSLAGRLWEPVGSFFWWPKTKDCVAHSVEPPVLLLILQENQETWPRAWGDLTAAAHLSRRRLAVIWLQKTAKTATARGAGLIAVAWLHKGGFGRVRVLTHCNAGSLATVDWGTALAPIYRAHNDGVPIHVWVDETRPRNQGASLTAWEPGEHGVPHTVIVDNAGGHLMREGLVDLCIVGTDRTTVGGDVANKIGTYLYLSQGAGGARQRCPVLRRAALADDRLGDRERRGDPDRAPRHARGYPHRRLDRGGPARRRPPDAGPTAPQPITPST